MYIYNNQLNLKVTTSTVYIYYIVSCFAEVIGTDIIQTVKVQLKFAKLTDGHQEIIIKKNHISKIQGKGGLRLYV